MNCLDYSCETQSGPHMPTTFSVPHVLVAIVGRCKKQRVITSQCNSNGLCISSILPIWLAKREIRQIWLAKGRMPHYQPHHQPCFFVSNHVNLASMKNQKKCTLASKMPNASLQDNGVYIKTKLRKLSTNKKVKRTNIHTKHQHGRTHPQNQLKSSYKHPNNFLKDRRHYLVQWQTSHFSFGAQIIKHASHFKQPKLTPKSIYSSALLSFVSSIVGLSLYWLFPKDNG